MRLSLVGDKLLESVRGGRGTGNRSERRGSLMVTKTALLQMLTACVYP